MASLLNSILGAENQSNLQDIASHLGIDKSNVEKLMGEVAPVLSQGLKQKIKSGEGADALEQAASAQQFIDDDNAKIYSDDAVTQGKQTLNHLMGDEAHVQEMADKVAKSTGVSQDVVQKLLPMAATMLMGSSSKQAQSGDETSLLSFLDENKDGSISDDLLGFAKRIFKH